jgi:hypothetical protein
MTAVPALAALATLAALTAFTLAVVVAIGIEVGPNFLDIGHDFNPTSVALAFQKTGGVVVESAPQNHSQEGVSARAYGPRYATLI